jgi:hypothetical protein
MAGEALPQEPPPNEPAVLHAKSSPNFPDNKRTLGTAMLRNCREVMIDDSPPTSPWSLQNKKNPRPLGQSQQARFVPVTSVIGDNACY